jgi:hypothetical protein
MATVTTIIKEAMGIIGAIAIDEAPTASEMTICLDAINRLIEQWSAQDLMIRETVEISQILTANKSTYTIGPSGGDITSAKPIDIDSGIIRTSAGVDSVLTIITMREYSRFTDKLTATGLPVYLAYDPGIAQQAAPVGTISLYPIPPTNSSSTQACTISNATPAVITCATHGYSINQVVVFATTGGLPAGLTVGVPYYIIAAGFTTGQFEVSLTLGGTAINTSSAGSSTHTVALSTASTLIMRASSPLVVFSTTVDTVTFDTMYSEALAYNLAIRIWRNFYGANKEIPSDIVAIAAGTIKTINLQKMELRHQRLWMKNNNVVLLK